MFYTICAIIFHLSKKKIILAAACALAVVIIIVTLAVKNSKPKIPTKRNFKYEYSAVLFKIIMQIMQNDY